MIGASIGGQSRLASPISHQRLLLPPGIRLSFLSILQTISWVIDFDLRPGRTVNPRGSWFSVTVRLLLLLRCLIVNIMMMVQMRMIIKDNLVTEHHSAAPVAESSEAEVGEDDEVF